MNEEFKTLKTTLDANEVDNTLRNSLIMVTSLFSDNLGGSSQLSQAKES